MENIGAGDTAESDCEEAYQKADIIARSVAPIKKPLFFTAPSVAEDNTFPPPSFPHSLIKH